MRALTIRRRLQIVSSVVALAVVVPLSSGLLGSHDVARGASNGRIAFIQNDGTYFQIYSANPDGTDQQQLTSDAFSTYSPSWTPDGSLILYVGDVHNDGTSELFRMNLDGTNKAQLTHDGNPKFGPQLSPDGTKIVYMDQDPNTFDTTIFVVNVDGSNPVQLTSGTDDESPNWKPDGTKIAYTCLDGSSNPQTCTMNPDGTGQVAITSGSASHSAAQWSPDGTKFAVIYSPSNYDDQLAVMNADGTGLQAIATGDNNNSTPSWSPDGTKVLYANQDFTGGDTAGRVYYVNAGGNGKTAVTPNDGTARFLPTWQPAGIGDGDHDGSLSMIENTAPGSGDANGDGLPDAFQAAVTSLVDPVSGAYAVVQSSCNTQSNVSAAATPADHPDAAYTYPAGVLSFTLSCGGSGTVAMVTQYYYGLTASSGLVLRKYNAATHTYTTVPGTAITSAVIGGQVAVKVTYQVTDGGAFDQDGAANGTIVDPVGLATPTIAVPDTGLGGLAYHRL